MGLKSAVCKISNFITGTCNFFSHFVNFGIRYYLFTIFFNSGLTKIKSWDPTVSLFMYEYDVTWLPLPPDVIEQFNLEIPKMDAVLAAYIGTGAEIILPILLLIGIGGRIPALMLFVFNYIALVSYPFLWTDNGGVGFADHILWGSLIGYIIFYGYGKISTDSLLSSKLKNLC